MGSHTLNALTVKGIAASKSIKLRDGGGLWLVTKGNGRYWILDYRFAGKRREMGIGPLHTIGLGEARQRAEGARALLRRGIDPIAHRAVEACARTVSGAGRAVAGDRRDVALGSHASDRMVARVGDVEGAVASQGEV